jgi:hypothetical protein
VEAARRRQSETMRHLAGSRRRSRSNALATSSFAVIIKK